MCYEFDRFAICQGYYLYSVLYAGGWPADIYAERLSRVKYRPGRSDEYLEKSSSEAKAVFGSLVRKHEATFIAYQRYARRHPELMLPWPGTMDFTVQAWASRGFPFAALEVWS